MIGVIGLGRAGLARLRAVRSLGLTLSAVASARAEEARVSLESIGFSEETRVYRDWRELVRDPEVKLTLICSESQAHEEQARAALMEGHHVCVEFPLATNADAASGLWALADRRDRVLHVEVIGTLTAQYRLTREWLMTSEATPHRWRSTLSAGSYRWVAEALSAGEASLLAFARIYQALSLFGPLKRRAARLESRSGASEASSLSSLSSPSSLLELTFESDDGVTVEIVERRAPGVRRVSQSALYDEQGEEITLERIRSELGSELGSEQALGGLVRGGGEGRERGGERGASTGEEREEREERGERRRPPLFEIDLCHFLALVSERDPHLTQLMEQFAASSVPDYARRALLLAAHELCDACSIEVSS